MAKATFELVGNELCLLPGSTLPDFTKSELAETDPIPLDCDLHVAICARNNLVFNCALGGIDDLPGIISAGLEHVWLEPCHEGGDPTQPVSGVKVRYQ